MSLDVHICADGLTFGVRATPRARVSAVTGTREGMLLVRLAAPPVDGKANAALCAFLAQWLGVRTADVRIVGGERARHKRVEVRGVTREQVLRTLPDGEAQA